MQRRSFLASMLAIAAAPAIVRAESLMKIAPRQIWVPPLRPEALDGWKTFTVVMSATQRTVYFDGLGREAYDSHRDLKLNVVSLQGEPIEVHRWLGHA